MKLWHRYFSQRCKLLFTFTKVEDSGTDSVTT